jgi:putative phage-type endonuclease
MIINNCEQGSESWYLARCGRVTGTRFKNLMSKDTTDSYKDLITDITCEMITMTAEESYSNANMEYGLETEPEARKLYESIFDVEVKTVGFIMPDEDNRFHEWIGISPDGLLPNNGILEIKCPKMRTHLEYIERGTLPSEYRYQVQGQLFVTGFDQCHFMSYVKNMKPFIIPVYPDLELFKEFEIRLDKLIEQVKLKLENYHKYDYLNE